MNRKIRAGFSLFLLGALLIPPSEKIRSAAAPSTDALAEDAAAVLRFREKMGEALRFMDAKPAVFFDPGRLPTAAEKERAREAWKAFSDPLLALGGLARLHRNFLEFPKARRAPSFWVLQSAFLAQYRFALEWIDAAAKNPALDTVLNEPLPELGLPANSFDKLKYDYLNVLRAGEFASLAALAGAYGAPQDPALRQAVAEDSAVIWKRGRGQGEIQTLRNAAGVVKKTSFSAWFPVQTHLSTWMGDTKVRRIDEALISAEQIAALAPLLEPGDVLLERREWYLSNVGLPGYWPHAAIYIGFPEERKKYFDDPAVRAWLGASLDFNSHLKQNFPAAYAASLAPDHGHAPRVLEAVSEGVSFTSLEHSAAADSLAVLRPRVSKEAKARALARAFYYAGRPYDFNFDFLTDAALVCTELVYKAYTDTGAGLRFPLVSMLGRQVMPANEMARQFDADFQKDPQWDLVVFLDGREKTGDAAPAGVEEFRRSWKRPKWHILLPDNQP